MFYRKKELTNVLSILVYCASDDSFLLLFDEERGDYWIPSTKMNGKCNWRDNLQAFKKKLFDYEIIEDKLLKIYKIWTLEKDYFHLIFQVNLPKEVKTNCKTETNIGKVIWCTCTQLARLRLLFRSLEILEVLHIYRPVIPRGTEKVTGEILPIGSLVEIRETDIIISAENCKAQIYLDLLDSANFQISEQYDLYEDYFMYTYPCIYMNYPAFRKAVYRFNFTGDLESLFRAADVWKRYFLTFQDFLFLIAVMEPYTSHYGNLAEIRCQYIFRYYDKSRNGKLNYSEVYNLISDIQLEKSSKSEEVDLNTETEVILKSINFKNNSFMTFDEFYSLVLQSKITDTSLLLRFKQSYYEVPESELRGMSFQCFVPSRIIFSSVSRSPEQQGPSYSVMLKTQILKPGETPFQVEDIKLLEALTLESLFFTALSCGFSTEGNLTTLGDVKKKQMCKSLIAKISSLHRKVKDESQDSMTKSVSEEFKSLTNIKLLRRDSDDFCEKIDELFLALQYFCSKIGLPSFYNEGSDPESKKAYTWGSAQIDKLGITLIMMCEELKAIMSAEPRLLEIDPPVFIMGDLHGNFHDLVCFEKTLWINGVSLVPAKLLFLGDYVDRGPNSVETVMYLFANKIRNPTKLYLIRGNHEIRDIQKLFTFQRECIHKFGNSLGMSVWKAVNEAFDVMPLAAIIDHKVFCCHGGIPPPWLCPVVSVINSIPCPLINCERQSPLAWTLMWNDPLKSGITRNSVQKLELLVQEGFMSNVQRGTGFYFSCEALEKFLMTNNLSHVVRAHEVVKAGFQIHQKGKLLTVFSSSGYCGGKNFAGSVLVADKFLRVCIVDTGINQKET